MSDDPPELPTHHEEALLQRLRVLARKRDAVPEHVTAAARAVLSARTRATSKPHDIGKEPERGSPGCQSPNPDRCA